MRERVLGRSQNAYSSMRILQTYAKFLKYSWQMRYWSNQTAILTADLGWGRLLGMNANALRVMLDLHIASDTDQQVKMDQIRAIWNDFERLESVTELYQKASDGTKDGMERVRRQCRHLFLSRGGQSGHTSGSDGQKRHRDVEETSGGSGRKSPKTARRATAPTPETSRGRGSFGRVTTDGSARSSTRRSSRH